MAAQPGQSGDPQSKGDMGPGSPRAMFLERRTYRRRRLMDAARLMPIVGAVLFAVPLLWPEGGEAGATTMSEAITYIFGLWAVLIGASVLFGLNIRKWADEWGGEGASGAPATGAPEPPSERGG